VIEIFPWNESFETGMPLIDEQHRHLVGLLNSLTEHLCTPEDIAGLKGIFGELKEYAFFHFTTEEACWEKILADDPWAIGHRAEHESFAETIDRIETEGTGPALDDRIPDIISFLTHWLVLHILDQDRRMALALAEITEGATVSDAKARANEAMNGASLVMVMTMNEHLASKTVQLAREIGSRKQAESRLNRALDELRAAKEVAETATLAKSTFLATMSHEIRTPLNSIIGLSHLSIGLSPEPRLRDYIEKIEASGLHLLGIINDVLDFSRIEAGKLSVEKIGFSLRAAIGSTMMILGDRAEEKGLSLTLDIDEELPENLIGDPIRIGQILLNFGVNAIKFTERGGVTIAVRQETVTESPDGKGSADKLHLRFEVSDTGIGIGSNQQDGLWQSFQQADMSTTRKYGGTGLGLAISKRLAELMEGRVGVESEPGVGSTFWFTVPLAIGKQAVEEEKKRLALWGCRVLLAEDDVINQEVTLAQLRHAGLEAELVPNGARAVERILTEPWDLVLMDIEMPVMDGLDATREIRKHDSLRNLPIIAMTANATREDREACFAAGMNDFLIKPIDPAVFLSLLGKWILPRGDPALRLVQATRLKMATETVKLLQGVSGIDIIQGLSRHHGKQDLYLSLVHKFMTDQRGVVGELRDCIESGNLDLAERRAQLLKSEAGNIGAFGIQMHGATLEQALKARQPAAELQAALPPLSTALDALLAAIESSFAQTPALEEDPSCTDAIGPVLEGLTRLLANDDIKATLFFEANAPAIRCALGPDFAELAAALRAFDFDRAKGTLASLAGRRA
jgi:hemerythrin-like metal-binding protein